MLRSQHLAKMKHKNQVHNLLPTFHEKLNSLGIFTTHWIMIKHI